MAKTADDLRDEFLALLGQQKREQVYQSFIEQNPRLVPREFVQNHGIHFALVLRKVPFGADFKSDFFYLSKSSDDWNAVFIELEKPQSKFFRPGTNAFHADFTAALQQINQWKAWFLAAGNQQAFLNGTVNAIRHPAVMTRNPTYNKYVLVFGRRGEYEANEDRRLLIKGMETDDFKIITYDSLVEGLHQKHDLFVGVRKNSHVQILSDSLVDDSVFGWVDPSQFSVNTKLHQAILDAIPSATWRSDGGGKFIDALEFVAPRLRRHT